MKFNYVNAIRRTTFLCLMYCVLFGTVRAQSSDFFEYSKPNEQLYFKELIKTSNDELVGVLQQQSANAVVQVAVRMDTLGNILWAYEFDRSGRYYYENIVELTNGNLVFGGNTDYAVQSPDTLIYTSLSSNGSYNWNKELRSTNITSFQYNGLGSDGNSVHIPYSISVNGGTPTYYIAAYNGVTVNLNWRKSYSQNPGFRFASHPNPGGGKFWAGNGSTMGGYQTFVLTKLNASGAF
ncbi:MAG: hypothetical protein AAF570_25930, partial [Bacteroidota bacterium]